MEVVEDRYQLPAEALVMVQKYALAIDLSDEGQAIFQQFLEQAASIPDLLLVEVSIAKPDGLNVCGCFRATAEDYIQMATLFQPLEIALLLGEYELDPALAFRFVDDDAEALIGRSHSFDLDPFLGDSSVIHRSIGFVASLTAP